MSESNELPLSDKEREYLKTGDPGSYTEKKMRERIEDKRDNIGSKLNRLVGDIALMYRSKYFEFNDTTSNIYENFSIYRTINQAFDNRLVIESAEITSREFPAVRVDQPTIGEEFGYYIGGLLELLLGLLPEKFTWRRILRGLLIFYLFVPEGSPNDKRDRLKELINFRPFDESSDEYRAKDTTGDLWCEVHFGYCKIEHNTKEQEFLQEQDIPTSEVLCDRLRSPVTDEEFPEYPTAEDLFERNLSECLEIDSFNRAIEVNKIIKSDIEYLKNGWRGPDRIDILEEMKSGVQRNTSNNIASGMGKASQDNLVETAFKKVSLECIEEDRWTTLPVVEKSGDQWEFTSYGELLVMYIMDNITNEEFARYGLPEKEGDHEMIAAVLAQMGDEI